MCPGFNLISLILIKVYQNSAFLANFFSESPSRRINLEKNQESDDGNSGRKHQRQEHGREDLGRGRGVAAERADAGIARGGKHRAGAEQTQRKNQDDSDFAIHENSWLILPRSP